MAGLRVIMTYNFWQIGYGNMGKPIAESLRKESHHINLHIIDNNISYDIEKLKYNNINQLTELTKPDIILFALKPQNIKSALAEYQNFISCNTKIISIMAGVTIDYLQKFLGHKKFFGHYLIPNKDQLKGLIELKKTLKHKKIKIIFPDIIDEDKVILKNSGLIS